MPNSDEPLPASTHTPTRKAEGAGSRRCLFAALLFELTNTMQAHFSMRRTFALPLVVSAIIAVIGIGGTLVAPHSSDQADKLTKRPASPGSHSIARRLRLQWQP